MIKVQGFAEQGNTVVYTGGLASITKVQGSFPGCTVLVTLHGTGGTHASIYSDDAATPTPLANPFTANADGTWGFYVESVRIDITFSGGDLPAPVTLYDAVTFGATGIPSYAYASLPTVKSEDAGNLARVTDKTRGIWMNTGVQWFATNGRTADVTEFGAVGDWDNVSGTDNKAAIDAAVAVLKAWGGGTLYFPPATGGYWYNGLLTIDGVDGLTVVMNSRQYNLDAEVPTEGRLVFTSAAHGVVFSNIFGLKLFGFQVDGADVCLNPLVTDQVYLARVFDISVYRTPVAGVAWKACSTSSSPATGTNWATVEGINLDHCGVGLQLTGVLPVSGSYVCTWKNIKINYTGNCALLLEECDNHSFTDTFFYRVSGTGVPVWFRKTTAYQVNNHSFFHLTGGGNSLPIAAWLIDPGIENPGQILGLDESNGFSIPAIADGCNLIVRTMGGAPLPTGMREPLYFRSGLITADSGSAGTIIRDDEQTGVMTRSVSHGFAYKERMDAANFRVVRSVNPDGSGFTDYLREGAIRLQTIAGISPGTLTGAFQDSRDFRSTGNPSDLLGSNGDTYTKSNGTAAAKDIYWHKEGGIWVHSVP